MDYRDVDAIDHPVLANISVSVKCHAPGTGLGWWCLLRCESAGLGRESCRRVSVVSVVSGTPFRLAQLARSDEPARPDPRRRRPNRRAPSELLLPTLPTITKAASCRPRVTSGGCGRCGQCSLVGSEAWRPPSPQLRAVGEAERSRSFGRRCFRAATRAGGTIDSRTPFPQNGFRAADGGGRTSGRIQSGRGTVP